MCPLCSPPSKIAGAAEFQIKRGNLEAGAQVAEFLQRCQAAASQLTQLAIWRNQQVRVSAAIRTSNAAAQLVQFREPVPVSAIDDDGVAEWNVQTVFDDGCGQQDVGLVPHEGQHHALQFGFGHLAMADQYARFGHHLADLVGDVVDALDAVVHEVDLAAAFHLFLDSRAQEFFIPSGNDRLDRHAIFGRRLDDAHVAQTEQRHVQGTRDGRGRHGQDVDFFAQLLQPFFVAHAEALLFVDDDQAQIAELHVLRERTMGADDDVHLAGGDFLDGLLLLLRGAEAAEHIDLDGKGREALLEGVVVLEGEHRGRRQHHDLAIVADCLEGRAHGDFRLAVTDVAAQQPVHRRGRLHVVLHVDDGAHLVFGFAELEAVLELALPFAVGSEGVALRGACRAA